MLSESKHVEYEAVRRVVVEHHELVYRLAYRVLGNSADAEDATQEVFLRWVEGRSNAEGIQSLRAWLARIAIHTSRNFIRAARNRRRREQAWAADRAALASLDSRPHPAGAPSREDNDMETRQTITRAIDSLPEELRLPIVLHYQEGFRYRDIAVALECPEGTVAKRIFTAKERLREQLKRSGQLAAVPFLDGALAQPPQISIPAGLEARVLERVSAALSARSAGAEAQTILSRPLVWSSLAVILGLALVGSSVWMGASGDVDRAQQVVARSGDDGGTPAIAPVVDPGRAAAESVAPDSRATTAAIDPGSGGRSERVAPAPPPLLAGTVRDEQGRAIEDAQVRVIVIDRRLARTQELAMTRTDAAGGYTIETLHAAPHTAAEPDVEPGAEPDDELTAIGFGGGGDAPPAGGMLMSADGGLIEVQSGSDDAQPAPPAAATPERVWVEATAVGCLKARSEAVAPTEGSTVVVDLQLAAASEIRGVVLGDDRAPVAGASVEITAHSSQSGSSDSALEPQSRVATSDLAGRFVLPGVPAGVHLLEARADGFVRGRAVAATGEGEAVLTLARAGRLRVTLSGATAGASVMDIEGRLTAGDDSFVAYGLSDKQGEIHFADLAAGKYQLYLYRGAFPFASAAIDVVAGGETAIAHAIDDRKVASLQGRVVLTVEHGADVGGAVIAVKLRDTISPVHAQAEAEVGPDGSFRFESLPVGDYRLIYRGPRPHFAVMAMKDVELPARGAGTDAVIQVDSRELAELAVTVVDEAGGAIENVVATLTWRFGRARDEMLIVSTGWSAGGTEPLRLRAPAGTYELTVYAHDHGQQGSLEVALAPREVTERKMTLSKSNRMDPSVLANVLPKEVTVDVTEEATVLGYFELVERIAPGCLELDPALVASGQLARTGMFPVRMPLAEQLEAVLGYLELVWETRDGKIVIRAAGE